MILIHHVASCALDGLPVPVGVDVDQQIVHRLDHVGMIEENAPNLGCCDRDVVGYTILYSLNVIYELFFGQISA